MLDLSVDGRIVTSSDVFNVIETDMASTASSMALTAPDKCTYDLGARTLTVAEAREIVLSRTAPDQLRNTIWAVLIRRTKAAQSRQWQRVAIWTMLPYLRAITYRLHRTWGTDLQDLRSEVVVGFLEALRQADPDQQHLGKRLWWNTYRIARQMCRQAAFEHTTADADRLAARTATDRTTPLPIDPDSAIEGDRDARTVAGERLGSLATQLGLRAVIANHPANTAGKVIFLPKNRSRLAPHAVNARGNGSGEAA